MVSVPSVQRLGGAARRGRDRYAQGVLVGVGDDRARQHSSVAAQLESLSGAPLPRFGEPCGRGPDDGLERIEPAPPPAPREDQQVAAPRDVEVGRQLLDPRSLPGNGLPGAVEQFLGSGEQPPPLAQGPLGGIELAPLSGDPLRTLAQGPSGSP